MSNYKFYDLGVVCGRFGHEQLGHVSLFDNCMSLCKRTLILVGSAQELGYRRLRDELMGVPVYKEIYDQIRKSDLSLDNFMKVYEEFEAKNKAEKLAELQK